jgi:hypothetical protein
MRGGLARAWCRRGACVRRGRSGRAWGAPGRWTRGIARSRTRSIARTIARARSDVGAIDRLAIRGVRVDACACVCVCV